MTTYYKATFENGSVQSRCTASRKYTHAWLIQGPSTWNQGGNFSEVGFSGSEQLARKALASWSRRDLTFSGVAPTVEITRQEYQALRAPK